MDRNPFSDFSHHFPRAAKASNIKLAGGLVLLVVGMLGLAFASVPLYRLFCQITGYGGTPQIATGREEPDVPFDRKITVRFDANTEPGFAWQFQPVQKEVTVRVGETSVIYYRATNLASYPLIGQASFNVTPDKAGLYFQKIQCFCFERQRLEPGQTIDMAVSFFVDPAIIEDRNSWDLHTITLSYTFFELESES